MSKRRVSARGRGNFLSAVPESKPADEESRIQEKKKTPLMKVGLQINPDLYFELKKQAASERRKLYELLNDAVAEHLERKRKD